MKTHTWNLLTLLAVSLCSLIAGSLEASEPAQIEFDRTEWHIDAVNGDDETGTGSREAPLKSIDELLNNSERFADFLSFGDTLYLAAGNYAADPLLKRSYSGPSHRRDFGRKW